MQTQQPFGGHRQQGSAGAAGYRQAPVLRSYTARVLDEPAPPSGHFAIGRLSVAHADQFADVLDCALDPAADGPTGDPPVFNSAPA